MKSLLLVCLLVMLTICGIAQRKALIIGINDYSSSQGKVRSLAGCVADAKSVRGLLMSRFGFQASEIDTIFNKAATKRNILTALRKLEQSVKKDDAVFFYYAGHGVSLINRYAMKGDSTTQGLLCADVNSPENSVIFDFELSAIYNRMIAKGAIVTVMFDCCHSGNMTMNLYPSAMKRRSAEEIRGVSDIQIWGDYDAGFLEKVVNEDTLLGLPLGDTMMTDAAETSKNNNMPTIAAGTVTSDTSARFLPYTDVDMKLRVNVRRPHEIASSRFLFIGAAQGYQKAHEKRDAHGQSHGIFTKALLSAYNQNSASMPVGELMNYIGQSFRTQFMSQKQMPNQLSDQARISQFLLGSPNAKPIDRVIVRSNAVSGNKVTLDAGTNANLEVGFELTGLLFNKLKVKVTKVISDAAAEASIIAGDAKMLASEKSFVITGRKPEVQPALTIYLPTQSWTAAELQILNQQLLKPALASPNFLRYGANTDAKVSYIFDNRKIWIREEAKPVTLLNVQPTALVNQFAQVAANNPFFIYLPLPNELANAVIKQLNGNLNVKFVTDPQQANFGIYTAYDTNNEMVVVCTDELVGNKMRSLVVRPEHLRSKLSDPYNVKMVPAQAQQVADLILKMAGTFRWLQ